MNAWIYKNNTTGWYKDITGLNCGKIVLVVWNCDLATADKTYQDKFGMHPSKQSNIGVYNKSYEV